MLCKVFHIRRNVIVDFCQNEPCFMPPVFFLFESYSLVDDENE